MLTVRIICVGKIKERFYTDAAAEYLKRLSRYSKTEIIELPDEKTPDEASPEEERQILEKEGKRILARLKDQDYCIALCVEGQELSSEALAGRIESLMTGGRSSIAFVIGGSLGLSPEVKKKADVRISFSRMTFPHQLMRVILLEQIYRSFRIIHHEPYHK